MSRWILCCLAAFALAACGDNDRRCGPGTMDDGSGTCVPGAPAPPVCTAGTVVNPHTNECEVDPASCTGGTVLVQGACVDPAKGLAIDVEEGAEPNAVDLGTEPSSAPAGSFVLKAVGMPGTVIHGRIAPRPDRDDDGQAEPDYDTYFLDITAPTLLRITVDGVGGTSGGFTVVTDAPNLEHWVRTAVAITTDIAKRTVYLPSAGRYRLAIADTRSLLGGTAVGGPTSEYYATIEQLPLPTPIAISGGTVTDVLAPGETRLYAAQLDTGLVESTLVTGGESTLGGLVVSNANAAREAAVETKTGTRIAPAAALVGRLDAAMTVFVVELETDVTATPTDFTLRVTDAHAVALAGTAVSAPAPTQIADLAQFAFDATAASQLLQLDLAWSVPVDGALLDDRGRVVSAFSWNRPRGTALGFLAGLGDATWTSYRGVFRAPAAGRYYLVLSATGSITGSGSVAPVSAGVVVDVPPSSEPWQRFALTAPPGVPGAHLSFYDQATTFGRLGDLVLHPIGGGPDLLDPGDGIPVVDVIAAPNNTGFAGHVMLGGPQHLIGVEHTGSSFDLAITAQSYTDEGTHQVPFTSSRALQTLDQATFRRLYLVRTAPNTHVDVTAQPSTGLTTLIASLAADETVLAFGTTSLGVHADERGYVAIQVSATAGTGTFDYRLDLSAPYYTSRVVSAGWSNACAMGTDVTPADRDDGFTAALPAPAGFTFYGAPVTALTVSTNGWLSFDQPAVTQGASRVEQHVPDPRGPNGLVAAYWDDLDQVRICTRTIGGKLVVQWRGVLFADPLVHVAAQAILDPSDDSVTLVYAPYHEATGTSASAGVERGDGGEGTSVFFRAHVVDPGSATKLSHP